MCSLFQNINYLHLGKTILMQQHQQQQVLFPSYFTGKIKKNTIVSNIPGMFNVCVKCLRIPFYYTVCIHFSILSLT